MKQYLFIGEHAETLASGLRVAPGDDVAASAVDPDSSIDKRLLDEGLLIQPSIKRRDEDKEQTKP